MVSSGRCRYTSIQSTSSVNWGIRPYQQLLAGCLGQHPAQVPRLLPLAPVGELHRAELGRVVARRGLDDHVVSPQCPAQFQRRRHQRAHVRLGEVSPLLRLDLPVRPRVSVGPPRQRLHGQPPHPGLVRRPDHADAHLPGPDAAPQSAVGLVGHHHRRVREPPPGQFLYRAPAVHRAAFPRPGHT